MLLSGLPVKVHPLLPLVSNVRSLASRAWHVKTGSGYATRVNKKWRKRFGTTLCECIQTPQGFFCSSEFANSLAAAQLVKDICAYAEGMS
jgi:hypothetical protein